MVSSFLPTFPFGSFTSSCDTEWFARSFSLPNPDGFLVFLVPSSPGEAD